MTTDLFREGLSQMADEAAPVDLYPQVLVASRRLHRRRVATTVAAVVAAIAFAGLGAAGINRLAAPPSRPPLDHPPSPSPSAPLVAPAGEGERGQGPPTDDDPGPVTEPAPATGRGFPAGMRLYFTSRVGAGLRLHSWQPGSEPAAVHTWTDNAMDAASLSPDGRWLSWVSGRSLKVSRLDGTQQRTVRTDLYDDTADVCFTPVWTADSRRLLVHRTDGSIGYADAASGEFRAVPALADGCHVRLSADGHWMAWYDRARDELVVGDPDGGQRRSVGWRGGMSTLSFVDDISPDGRYVSVSGSINGSRRGNRRVLDVATGVGVRYTQGYVNESGFLRDGSLFQLLDSGLLVLVDPRGTSAAPGPLLLWRGDVPAAVSGGAILGVR